MSDELIRARHIASTLRYCGDKTHASLDSDDGHLRAVRGHAAQNALRISHEVTPNLSDSLDLVCRQLQVPASAIEAYVYCSPEIQADCFAGHDSQCVIRFSSALIDILDRHEFAFVAGHELGHFLLGHGGMREHGKPKSVEYYMRQRAQEISVDRIGLYACRSLDVAIKALMKTISGLSSVHLRFDAGAFISQLRHSDVTSDVDNRAATHPSLLVRCRALLWFSLTEAYSKGTEGLRLEEFATLDRRVESDFQRYVDGPARRQIQAAKDDFAMWNTALSMAGDGVFTNSEQDAFSSMFGRETLNKLKNLLSGLSRSEAEGMLRSRTENSRAELEELIPESLGEEVAQIEAAVGSNRYRSA